NYDAMVLDSWDPEDFVVPNSGAVPADDPWEADPEGPFPAEPQRAPVSIASPVSEATDEAQLERTRRYSDSVCRQPAPDTAGIEGLLTAATRIPRRRHLPIECEDW